MPSYVYFITDNHGHIKIGKADDTFERLKDLQTGNPYKLVILLSIRLSSPLDAFDLECILHERFRKYQLEGEWFEAEPVLKLIDTDIVTVDKYQFGGLQYGKKLSDTQLED